MQSPNTWIIGGQPGKERPGRKYALCVAWDHGKHALNNNPSLTRDTDGISGNHAMQIHRVCERQRCVVKRANTIRDHLEAVTMHVERMTARPTHTLQDYSDGLVPIRVRDNHKVSLFWGRGRPCRVLLNGIQSGISGVVDIIDQIIHEGMNPGPTEEGERVI